MTQHIQRDYFNANTAEVARFTEGFRASAAPGGTFDSAAAAEFRNDSGTNIPSKLQAVYDEAGAEGAALVERALFDGASDYEREHGTSVPADVMEQAIHAAYTNTAEARRRITMDSATSLHHDQLSLQPNRAVVSILSILTEAIPFAHYLPADIGSNEAKLAIMSHKAGSTFGGYAQNALMDGVASGDAYLNSARTDTITFDGTTGAIAGKVTAVQSTIDDCDGAAGDLKVLRGRTIIYVNGLPVGGEAPNTSGTGNSPMTGSVTLGATTYTLSGNINTDTGAYTVASTPGLPNGTKAQVTAFIDYEANPSLTPVLLSAVDVFSLHANPWRAKARHSIDSRHQMANELGLDPYSESIIAMQSQFSNERHYDAISKGVRIGRARAKTFDLNYGTRSTQLVRSQMWQDFAYPLALASQEMAVDTLSGGITHLYVTKSVAAQLLGLPSTLFQPSGLSPRPGIYRLGRLFGQYDVYYTPKGLSETATTAQVLCVGRANDVARNPIVLGDAVPPTAMPLAIGDDMSNGAAFYARNFTSVNPHQPSAKGFAIIEITGM